MRRPLVIGNWKMNGSLASVVELAQALKSQLASLDAPQLAVCPSFVHIPAVLAELAESGIAVGAQNTCADADEGAFTGEVSAEMLADLGCHYVLVGHSERRLIYGDSDDIVVAKFERLLQRNLTPVLCVGETQQQREEGNTEKVVVKQLSAVVNALGVDVLAKAVVAYEPVWAIGTGLTASPDQAQAVHAYLRQLVAASSAGVAQNLQILYGGSVKASNAAELFSQPDIDGGLVGGAALNADEFAAICAAAG